VKIYKRNAFFNALFAFFCLAFLFWHRPPYDLTENVFSGIEPPEKIRQAAQFHDVSGKWGVNYRNQPLLGPNNRKIPVAALIVIMPSVSVVDVNGDGFMDIFIASQPNRLYINEGGHSFHEAAADYGIDSSETRGFNSFGLFADFNGDGNSDLLLAHWPCHRLFYGQGTKKGFIEQTRLLGGYCSNAEAVNVLDFDKDGRLDLVFGNLLGKPDEKPASFPYWFSAPRYDNTTGAQTDLLVQTAKGDFVWRKDIPFANRPYSHAVGISDVNDDGWPDIFIANDYSSDQLFINNKGKSVTDEAEIYIPRELHGLTGMNAEFADVNNDGLIDLFVANGYKPPFLKAINLLWLKKSDARGFDNVSLERGLGRCGFAWGSKFADFNNDGRLDLAVANGRDRGELVTREGEGHSFWFERTVINQIPLFLKSAYATETVTGSGRFANMYTSAFERDCLFMQDSDGKFYDIAPYTDIGDSKEEGRGLALIDADNDGKMDFLVTNLRGDLRFWHNDTVENGDWIGFTLKDQNGNSIPHGSFARLVRDGAHDMVIEHYPANGYKGQSDPRLHFGLGRNNKLKYLEVKWPSGQVTRHSRLQINKYQTISQKGN
jgi:enediyne biosynthesis protein E4